MKIPEFHDIRNFAPKRMHKRLDTGNFITIGVRDEFSP